VRLESPGGLARNQPPDHRGGDHRAGDTSAFPIRPAGDAEQQDALGNTQRSGLNGDAVGLGPSAPPGSTYMPSLETAARSLKVELITAPVHSDEEIETAIIALGREPGGGLVAFGDLFMIGHLASTISAAA